MLNETRLAQRRIAKKDESVAFTGRNKFLRFPASRLATFRSVTATVEKIKIFRSKCSNGFLYGEREERRLDELYPLLLVRFYDRGTSTKIEEENFPTRVRAEKGKRKR